MDDGESTWEGEEPRLCADKKEQTMPVKTATYRLPETYFKLVKRFPLVHIRDDAHLRLASDTINWLLQEDRDKGAEEYLDVLTDLVEAYESQHVLIPDASEADVLRELMRANGLSQLRLAKEVKIAQSTISAVVTGSSSRSPRKTQKVLKLAKVFPGLSPAAFGWVSNVTANWSRRVERV